MKKTIRAIKLFLAENYLKNLNEGNMAKNSEKRVMEAIKKANKKTIFYRSYFESKGIDLNKIRDFSEFKKTRITFDKETLFVNNKAEEICFTDKLEKAESILISSGYENGFSYSTYSKKSNRIGKDTTDFLLDLFYQTGKKKTLIVNALSMGVKVLTSNPTAETSARSDRAAAIIEILEPSFQQIILIADPNFAKKILEEGIEKGIDWKKINLHLIIGDEPFSESYRSYIAKLAGINLKNKETGSVISSLGTSEIGLNIMNEVPELVLLKRKLAKEPALRKKIFGSEKYTPTIFQYYPQKTYIEQEKQDFSKLIFTDLDKESIIPIIRYKTGDVGMTMSYSELGKKLKELNLTKFLPKFKLPILFFLGRNKDTIRMKDKEINTMDIKEILFEDFNIARNITGYFTTIKKKDYLLIRIQKRGLTETNMNKLKNMMGKAIGNIEMEFVEYEEIPGSFKDETRKSFPIDYEKKFHYV